LEFNLTSDLVELLLFSRFDQLPDVRRVGGELTLMKAGGHSQKDKNPSRAAASVQTARPSGVILVEPRDLVRDCVAICLRVADPGFTVLQYSSVYEVDLVEGADCVALVLSFLSADREIPDMAVEVSRAQDQLPNVPVVVIAEGDELSFVRKVIGSGVRGYVPTSFDFAMFKEAIQFVAAGGTFVPASVLRGEDGQMSDVDEADHVVKHGSNEVIDQNSNETQERSVAASFTPRELEVISCLKDGKSNKMIARELAITEGTVKLYIGSIMKKLRVENRTQAALLATTMQLPE
jgi:DNA-binding NarL/FixJ family response regulator